MLPDGETENIGGVGEAQTVDGDIVGGLCDLGDGKVLELVGDQDLS